MGAAWGTPHVPCRKPRLLSTPSSPAEVPSSVSTHSTSLSLLPWEASSEWKPLPMASAASFPPPQDMDPNAATPVTSPLV